MNLHLGFCRPRPSRRGAISILTALGILLLLMIVGVGIDTALVMTANQQLQRAADATALAAANQFQYAQAADWPLVRAKAIETAALQDVVGRGGSALQLADNPTNAVGASGRQDMLIGRWDFNRTTNVFEFVRTDFSTGLPHPNAIQIYPRCGDGTANSPLALLFSPLFGATATSDVGRPATAVSGPKDIPLILVLDPHGDRAFHLNGSVNMDVEAGTVHIDSDAACAFDVDGSSGILQAQRTRVVGDACYNPSNLSGDLITHSFYVPDPLAGLASPTTAGMTNYDRINSGGTYGPGYYPNGIGLTGGTATLNPGLYYIENGITLRGNSQVTGTGVCIYLATGASSTGGGAMLNLTPPTSGTYQGIAYFQSRTNTTTADIGGVGSFEIQGTMYLPNAMLMMSGNVSRRVGRIVVWRLDLSGNPGYEITGRGVPVPTDPPHVFLVK